MAIYGELDAYHSERFWQIWSVGHLRGEFIVGFFHSIWVPKHGVEESKYFSANSLVTVYAVVETYLCTNISRNATTIPLSHKVYSPTSLNNDNTLPMLDPSRRQPSFSLFRI